ncbi:MAG TPA: DUF2063 domain-containing protein [Gammaproteobacteria bacterium]|nr:DUF2063 domain-containing protein [Gammaproteobacteria bacterium]
MTDNMHRLQSEFQTFLFSGRNEQELQTRIAESNDIPATARLAVYRNAYYIRLQEALAHDFPTLLAVAGDARFGKLSARFIRANPSRHPSLRDFGRALPGWLREGEEGDLAEVAALEWAVLEAFDAADHTPVAAEALAQVPPEEWEYLGFDFHPSVSLLKVSCNVRECWSVVRNDKGAVPALRDTEEERLVVWRAACGPAVQAIEPALFSALLGLKDGRRFGECCLQLAEQTSAEQAPAIAAQALALACNSGWITHIQHDTDQT